MKIALLASGQLGFSIFNELLKIHTITAVFTDKGSIDIINQCEELNISCFIGNPRNGRATEFLQNMRPEMVLSVNYLFLIEKDIIEWPTKLAVNVHGSLLPKYRGRTPHVWAIINNEKEAGITAHIIDESCDSGDIVAQMTVPIEELDTGADILKKYNEKYPELVRKVLDDIQSDKLNRTKQDESLASFFGKRTPDDGLINWDWQKERIKNWVRAQANPYPGAFTFYNNEKLIIDEVRFSDFGFSDSQSNGTVLSLSNGIVVKTPNGAVEITKMRNTKSPHLKVGDTLK